MPHKGKKKLNKKVSLLKIGKKKRKRLQLKSTLKNKCLMMKNLSYKATEKDIQEYLHKFGEICKVQLLKKSNGNLTGRGVVEFTNGKGAAEAVQNCNGKEFMGRKIVVDWITPASDTERIKKVKNKSKKKVVIKEEEEEEEEEEEKSVSEENLTRDVKSKTENGEVKTKKRKGSKKAKSLKKGRLIVRNLPFKVTESNLMDHFKKFGEITEVTLLRKADGKLVGCGFIQFANKNCAAKAILECSGKPLLGRPVVVDWAVPKSTFKANDDSEQTQIKQEPDDEKEESKPSLSDDDDDDVTEIAKEKQEPLTDESDEESDDDSDENISDTEEKYEDKSILSSDIKKEKVISNDISEGRTVFIKNMPFSATNEDLKTCMEQFGKVIYALVCIDPDTEHSKGTAFVKFQKKESAEECLSAGTELMLHDQILDAHRALNKEDLQKRSVDKQKEKINKDSRNLYLVKEGVIVAGSKAAAGVSMTDMSKRLQLEQSKSQLLRNLNMYVSRVRLVIHNLPPSWTDVKLRQLFSRYAGPNAVIKEARVMRDLKNVDAQGVGKSKEYGFVTFTRHENALEALRNINNNPDIFTAAKRPIVSFSVENKAILNIKRKRLERSQAKNPLSSEKRFKDENRRKHGKSQDAQISNDGKAVEEGEKEAFVGVTSKPGNVKMRNRFKIQTQAKIHSQMVHKTKLKQKKKFSSQQKMQIAKEKMKDSKTKKGAKRKHDEEDSAFNTLVNKYRKKLTVAPSKKWYE